MNNYKKYREAKGLTQREVSYKVGVTIQTISNIENNRSSSNIELAIKLAKLYGVTVEELESNE